MRMIVDSTPFERTPEELSTIRKGIEMELGLVPDIDDEDAVIRIHKGDEKLLDFEKAKLEFLKVIYPEKVIAPEDMEDFTKP